ncbi:Crp/Fnr family transcriptional regulator [uncultured Croceitalea sp.]|uniref:Crp/Fnr family transcriptional regulator n=1 Tax=uncultured Croceitalea sp. TaxID=1798908 RepID=UPI003305EBB3
MIRINEKFLDYITKLEAMDSSKEIIKVEAAIGEALITQKTNVLFVYIIKKGLTKCYLTEDTGNDFIQEFFGEGEVFGELEVITGEFSFCTIETLTPVECYRISKETFLKLIKNDSIFNSLVLNLMATKIRYTALRHSYNQSHVIEDRLKGLYSSVPDLFTRITKNDIANYLGVTIRSLNRAIKTLDLDRS